MDLLNNLAGQNPKVEDIGNGVKISVVVQQLNRVFDAYGCNHAIERISYRHALGAKGAIDCCCQKEGVTIHRKVDEVGEGGFGFPAMVVIPDSLEHLREDDSAQAQVLALFNEGFERRYLRGITSRKEIDPYGGVHKRHSNFLS